MRPFTPLRVLLTAAVAALGLAVAPGASAQDATTGNDLYTTARLIDALPYVDDVDATTLTGSADDPLTAGSLVTAWYQLSLAAPTNLALDLTASTAQAECALFRVDPTRAELPPVSADMVAGSAGGRLDVPLDPGLYVVMAVTFEPSGRLVLAADTFGDEAPPANDLYEDAIVLTELPVHVSVDTRGATASETDPYGGVLAHSVWFRLIPPRSAPVSVSMDASNYLGACVLYERAPGAVGPPPGGGERVVAQPGSPAAGMLVAGTTYDIFCVSLPGGVGGTLVLDVTELPTLGNDDLDGATLVTDAELPLRETRDASKGTVAADDPLDPATDGYVLATFWYRFECSRPVSVRVADLSNLGGQVAVFTGVRGALTRAAFGTGGAVDAFTCAPGDSYLVMFATRGTQLAIGFDERPENDAIEDATVIGSLPFTAPIATTGVREPTEPQCGGHASAEMWWRYTAPTSMCVGASGRANLAIYRGELPGLELLQCPFTSQPTAHSTFVRAGETIYIGHASAESYYEGFQVEVRAAGSGQDGDGDGVPDACDDCPAVSDPDQRDSDLDGAGDACDPCPERAAELRPDSDSDGDGRGDACDNCVATPNGDQADRDGDLRGDACDVCPLVGDPSQVDRDRDGVGDLCDSCPTTADATQANHDDDDRGDVCDACPALDDVLPAGWERASDLLAARQGHAATVLTAGPLVGQVLVTGGLQDTGDSPSTQLADAELWDPSTGLRRAAPALPGPRVGHLAIALTVGPHAGQVLIVGTHYWSHLRLGAPRAIAVTDRGPELYDPVTGATTPTGPAPFVAIVEPRGVSLPDGRILMHALAATTTSGGFSGYVYDPRTDAWSTDGGLDALLHAPLVRAMTLMADGRALVVSSTYDRPMVFDPATRAVSDGAPYPAAFYPALATALAGSRVLVVGDDFGVPGPTNVRSYDVATGAWSAEDGLPGLTRDHGALVTLPSGDALMSGGEGELGVPNQFNQSEAASIARADLYRAVGDEDGDGLDDRAELAAGTSMCSADTDGDGWDDRVDPDPLDGDVLVSLRRLVAGLASVVAGSPTSAFVGPNTQSRRERQKALGELVDAAGKCLRADRKNEDRDDDSDGDHRGPTARARELGRKLSCATERLRDVAARTDGIAVPADWMVAGAARTAVNGSATHILELIGWIR